MLTLERLLVMGKFKLGSCVRREISRPRASLSLSLFHRRRNDIDDEEELRSSQPFLRRNFGGRPSVVAADVAKNECRW